MTRLALGLALLAVVLAAAAWWAVRWVDEPMPLRQGAVEATVEPGSTARVIAQRWVAAGVDVQPWLLHGWFRVSGQAERMRAGSYGIAAGTTPRQLLDKMVRGEELLESVTLVEGWTFRQVREVLAKAPHLQPASAGMEESALMAAIGAPSEQPAEGRFFPDTYRYARGTPDLIVLRRAHQAMRTQLEAIWADRAPDLPLNSADEALILASIIEKETGRASDRGLVAGVFINRLRIDMPLQTDPTVIYGLGAAFDGNLRRRDLRQDTPWNTYTRRGLPPTPIALPGLAALRSAVRPDATKALYFVARGDGSSAFSETLEAHNRAVNQYQRGGR